MSKDGAMVIIMVTVTKTIPTGIMMTAGVTASQDMIIDSRAATSARIRTIRAAGGIMAMGAHPATAMPVAMGMPIMMAAMAATGKAFNATTTTIISMLTAAEDTKAIETPTHIIIRAGRTSPGRAATAMSISRAATATETGTSIMTAATAMKTAIMAADGAIMNNTAKAITPGGMKAIAVILLLTGWVVTMISATGIMNRRAATGKVVTKATREIMAELTGRVAATLKMKTGAAAIMEIRVAATGIMRMMSGSAGPSYYLLVAAYR